MNSMLNAISKLRPLCNTMRNLATEGSPSDLIITERCVERMKQIIENGENLRVTVDGGGCSGFEYKIKIDKEITDNDIVFNKDGVKIIVDKISFDFMRGATVDYVEELMRSSFRVLNNPVAEKGCSCGSSFAVKLD